METKPSYAMHRIDQKGRRWMDLEGAKTVWFPEKSRARGPRMSAKSYANNSKNGAIRRVWCPGVATNNSNMDGPQAETVGFLSLVEAQIRPALSQTSR